MVTVMGHVDHGKVGPLPSCAPPATLYTLPCTSLATLQRKLGTHTCLISSMWVHQHMSANMFDADITAGCPTQDLSGSW